jgi:glycosyltransferase involved in cell wall biosynthesis
LRPPDAHSNPAPPSVLMCGGFLGGGGVQTHLTLLCQLLRRHRATVVLLATGRNWSIETIEEVRSWGVEMRLPPAVLAKSRRLCALYSNALLPIGARGKFTSIYSVGEGRSQLRVRRFIRGSPISVYHEIVDSPSPDNLRGRCAVAAHAVAANSKVVAGQFLHHWPKMNVRVIPFLTAAAPMAPPAARPPVGNRTLRLAYLGRIIGHKRPDELVKQWKRLVAGPPLNPARLDIYGYGNQELSAQMQSIINQEKLGDQIVLRGSYQTSELDSIIGNADVVVLPSIFEGLPLVLVEAMQRGVPVVACASGGSAEFGDDNPDVRITSTEWDDFVRGLFEMAAMLRLGKVDAVRLHRWAESRYGYEAASKLWLGALLRPHEFWGIPVKN